MPDVGKVIKGLECCIETSEMCWDNPKCPYNGCEDMARGEGCMSLMMRDALALLKAQEARVMTLEEVKAAAEHDVWIELSGNFADDVLFAATIEGCGTKGLCTRYESHNYSAYGIKPYGWRCWTSRPTEAQREATPWN